MQLPPIPPSVRTSAAGFAAALFGWLAAVPSMPPALTILFAALASAATGTGFYLAADHRTVAKATARACATCGRPAIPPPPPSDAAETLLP